MQEEKKVTYIIFNSDLEMMGEIIDEKWVKQHWRNCDFITPRIWQADTFCSRMIGRYLMYGNPGYRAVVSDIPSAAIYAATQLTNGKLGVMQCTHIQREQMLILLSQAEAIANQYNSARRVHDEKVRELEYAKRTLIDLAERHAFMKSYLAQASVLAETKIQTTRSLPYIDEARIGELSVVLTELRDILCTAWKVPAQSPLRRPSEFPELFLKAMVGTHICEVVLRNIPPISL